MSEWKEYRFSEFVDINPSVKLPKDELISFVEMKDLDSGKRYCLPSQERLLSGGSKFEDGDTLFARITPCLENGKICQVKGLKNGQGLGSTEFHIFRGKENVSNSDFVYYLSLWDEVRDHAEINLDGTSGRQRVPKEAFNDLILTLPLLPEQQAIASALGSLDDKIDLLHRQNATLEKMAEALFRQWFVEEEKDEWEILKLDSIISIGSGKGLKRDNFVENGLYPVLGANGEIGRTNQFLSGEKLIYTGRVGTLGNIFRVENEKVWLSDNTLIIRPLKHFNFVYFLLKSSHLEDYDVGSTQPLIRQQDVKEIEFKMPTEHKLDEFELFAEDIFDKIKSNQNQICTLTALHDTLLPKLMSGEVRVKY